MMPNFLKEHSIIFTSNRKKTLIDSGEYKITFFASFNKELVELINREESERRFKVDAHITPKIDYHHRIIDIPNYYTTRLSINKTQSGIIDIMKINLTKFMK